MLYLEDYLEMIEHLPQELRDRFTEMRELDLQVQNSIDSLEKKTRVFFLQCKRGELQSEALDAEFESLRKEYYKVLEDADEKVTIATQIHELVERYLRRLDSELYKFKCELEADNNGITEILEKRSLEMDGNSSAASALLNYVGMNHKENRIYSMSRASKCSNLVMSVLENNIGGLSLPAAGPMPIKETRYRTPKLEKRRDSISTAASGIPEKRQNISNSLTPSIPPVTAMRPITPSLSGHAVLNTAAVTPPGPAAAVPYSLGGIGASASNAIAVAASQAIVATQQMQQGRRTASLKASYEAIHGVGGGPTEFWISRDIANAATAAAQNTLQATGTEKKHKKKLNSSLSHGTSATNNVTLSSGVSLASSSSSVSADSVDMLAPVPGPSISTIGVSGSAYNSGASTSAAAANRNSVATVATAVAAGIPSANLGLTENGLAVEPAVDSEWSYDPNEPRYCTCNQVSYGDMVACDNDACPYEWFHYPCVGITQPPKGKWYCPKCTASMRRRGNRKN